MALSPRSSCLVLRLAAVSLLSLTTLAAPAHAEVEPSPTELAVARRLFDEAVQLEKQGKWQLAAEKLRAAIQVKDTPGLRFHLAHCQEKLGLLVEALLDYRRASDLIEGGFRAPDVGRLLRPAREALEARVPLLVVAGPADIHDVVFELDGRVLEPAVVGRPAPVNPGTHRVTAHAPGYLDFAGEVTLEEGERQSIDVLMRRAPEPAPSAPAPEPLPAPAKRVAAVESETSSNARTYVVATESALALAGLGVGVAYWIVRDSAGDRVQSAQRASREASSEPNACAEPESAELARLCEGTADAISDYNRARWISAAGFVTAGVGAAAAVLTFALWPDDEDRPRVAAAPTTTGVSLFIGAQF